MATPARSTFTVRRSQDPYVEPVHSVMDDVQDQTAPEAPDKGATPEAPEKGATDDVTKDDVTKEAWADDAVTKEEGKSESEKVPCDCHPADEKDLDDIEFSVKDAMRLIEQYYTLKRGYSSAIFYAVMYIFLVCFMTYTEPMEEIAPQNVMLVSNIPPTSQGAAFSAQAVWTDLIGGGLIGESEHEHNATEEAWDAEEAAAAELQDYTSTALDCLLSEEWNSTLTHNGATVTTKGYDYRRGYVVGGILLTTNKKKTQSCENYQKFPGPSTRHCYELEPDSNTAPLVLSNGLEIPFDSHHDGHSVFLPANLARHDLTRIAQELQTGGFFDPESYDITYEAFVFFPSSASLVAMKARLKDEGSGGFVPSPVYPSRGAKYVGVIKIGDFWTSYGYAWFFLFALLFMWTFYFIVWVRGLHKARVQGGDLLQPFEVNPGSPLGYFWSVMLHQPHALITKDKEKQSKEDHVYLNVVEEEENQRLMETWEKEQRLGDARKDPFWATSDHDSAAQERTKIKEEQKAPYGLDGALYWFMPFVLHTSLFLYLVVTIVMISKVQTLTSTFEDQDWLVRLKTEAHLASTTEVTSADINAGLSFYSTNMHDQLDWMFDEWGGLRKTKYIKDWSIMFLFIVGAFRLLEHFVFQRLLNTLTEALHKASQQLLHTFLIFGIVLMGFAFVGRCILSRQVFQFRGSNSAFKYTIELAFRAQKVNYIAMTNIGFVGTSYALMLKVVVIGIALKMLLALIIDSYKAALKENTNEVRGLFDDVKLLWYVGHNDAAIMFAKRFFQKMLSLCCGFPKHAWKPTVHPRDVYLILAHIKQFEKYLAGSGHKLPKDPAAEVAYIMYLHDKEAAYYGTRIGDFGCLKISDKDAPDLPPPPGTTEDCVYRRMEIWIQRHYDVEVIQKLMGGKPKSKEKKK